MSVSLSFQDLDAPWLSTDASVGPCRSSCARNVSSRRFAIDDVSFNGSALHLSKTCRVSSHDCDRSLQELDDTVASVTRMHHSAVSLDNGERSPTSVSYVCSKDPIEEKVIRHLARPIDLRRVESASGKSTLSRSSRNSRGSKASRVSRRKRGGNLERKISQVIICSASVSSESSYSTKDCNESACRSAQFILTDLFYEASKTKNELALPHPPFANGTSWSQLTERSVEPQVKLDPHGLTLSGSFPPRHPFAQTTEQEQTPPKIERTEVDKPNAKPARGPLQRKDPLADLDILPAYSAHIDVIKEAENESEISSFLALESYEQGTSFTLKRDNTMDASDCTEAVAFSLDVDDSVFQYSSTTFSQFSKAHEASATQSNTEKGHGGMEQTAPKVAVLGGEWTSFDGSPFQGGTNSTDDFDFESFLPFESEKNGKSSSPALKRVTASAPTAHDILPEWATSVGSSPSSPASLFNVFSTDDDNAGDESWGASDSRSDTLWDISDFPHGSFAATADLEAPFA
jgi:hypothetical protein